MPKSKVRAKARKKAAHARTGKQINKGTCPDSCCSAPVQDRPRP